MHNVSPPPPLPRGEQPQNGREKTLLEAVSVLPLPQHQLLDNNIVTELEMAALRDMASPWRVTALRLSFLLGEMGLRTIPVCRLALCVCVCITTPLGAWCAVSAR